MIEETLLLGSKQFLDRRLERNRAKYDFIKHILDKICASMREF